MARNFIKSYGYAAFLKLLTMFQQGLSGPEIGKKFNVSRERVRQWKNAFGETIVTYNIYPEVIEEYKNFSK
tara:strand:- start:882 stop:1094 length:213 start_codon:yes stop_codon:yes gene_type:complete